MGDSRTMPRLARTAISAGAFLPRAMKHPVNPVCAKNLLSIDFSSMEAFAAG